METENYVAVLHQYAQREHWELKYEEVGSAGPAHIKTFTLRAILNGKAYPDGEGKNKKEARQNAAKNVLRGLLDDPPPSTEHAAEPSASPVHQTGVSTINYIGWLNEYGHRNSVSIRPVETISLGQHNTTRFVVGDKEYPAVFGKTVKEAKLGAAKLVYDELCGSKTTETGDEKYSSTASQKKEDRSQNVSDICKQIKSLTVRTDDKTRQETDFMGIVNCYCQTTNRSRTFIEERRCGPPHNPQFFYKLVIDNKEYPVAEGKTVKEAKQNAAQLAWSALREQSDWDSKSAAEAETTDLEQPMKEIFMNGCHGFGAATLDNFDVTNKASFRSAVSDDGALAKLSTSPSTQDSGLPKSPKMTTTTSDSVIFTNSSIPPKDQVQSPDVKPKIKIAANFQNACKNSKEGTMPNFSGKNPVKCQSEKTPTQSVTSRFTSEFDSIERLGKGAFGRVFKANQKLLDKYYAIKIVRCKEKALREVGALSDLHHRNIVRYYTCWMEDSEYHWDSTTDSCSTSESSSDSSVKYLYIQMELCDTKTLRIWIDEKNIQNVKKSLRDSKRREESLTIAQQIVNGVDYIHDKMLIHRDLKPANIMFGRDGEVKIGDFGLVTAENDDDAENLKERTAFKGTPSYMAPEQMRSAESKNTYDRKVDIFALGLTYFELLWNISTGHERAVIWDDARNQKLPTAFSHHFHQESLIIKSMLCVKPDDRPEARKLKTDLEECEQLLKVHRDSKTY